MSKSNTGVRRPLLYVIAGILGVAMAAPLAVATGQARPGGIFDECYGASCDGYTIMAEAGAAETAE